MDTKALLRKVLDAIAALEGTGAEVRLTLGRGDGPVAEVRELSRMTGEPVESRIHASVTGEPLVFEAVRISGAGATGKRPTAEVCAFRAATERDMPMMLRGGARKDWYARLDANAAQNAGVR